MALTEAQIIDCMDLLGLPARVDVSYQYGGDQALMYRAGQVRLILGQLNSAQETKVGAILTEFAEIEFDADELDTPEGLKSKPARTRKLLAGKLARVIGWTGGYGSGGGQPVIARG